MKTIQLFILISFLLIDAISYSQDNGRATIDGKITDSHYKDLSGVNVLLKNAATSLVIDSTATRNGQFKFSGVTPGLYRLQFGQDTHADTSFAFSIGQAFPSHNQNLLLFFTCGNDNPSNIALQTQKRQFSGSNNEWYGSAPPGKLFNLIAEYEWLDSKTSNNLCGTTLNQHFRALKAITVKLYRAGEVEPIAKTVSDVHGNYTFADVPSGLYKMVFAINTTEAEGATFEVRQGWKLTLKDAVRPEPGKAKQYIVL